MQNALQTPEQDSEGLLSRIAERLQRQGPSPGCAQCLPAPSWQLLLGLDSCSPATQEFAAANQPQDPSGLPHLCRAILVLCGRLPTPSISAATITTASFFSRFPWKSSLCRRLTEDFFASGWGSRGQLWRSALRICMQRPRSFWISLATCLASPMQFAMELRCGASATCLFHCRFVLTGVSSCAEALWGSKQLSSSVF